MNSSKILEVVFLGENEDNGIVSISTTGMHLNKKGKL